MAYRTTGDLVKGVFDTDLTAQELTPFVKSANLMVNTHLTNKGLGSALLADIETYLAAHFATLFDPRAKSEKIGDFSATYQGETGEGLKASHYGQMAIMLDSSNTLASLGMQRATVRVLRTPAHGTQTRSN